MLASIGYINCEIFSANKNLIEGMVIIIHARRKYVYCIEFKGTGAVLQTTPLDSMNPPACCARGGVWREGHISTDNTIDGESVHHYIILYCIE